MTLARHPRRPTSRRARLVASALAALVCAALVALATATPASATAHIRANDFEGLFARRVMFAANRADRTMALAESRLVLEVGRGQRVGFGVVSATRSDTGQDVTDDVVGNIVFAGFAWNGELLEAHDVRLTGGFVTGPGAACPRLVRVQGSLDELVDDAVNRFCEGGTVFWAAEPSVQMTWTPWTAVTIVLWAGYRFVFAPSIVQSALAMRTTKARPYSSRLSGPSTSMSVQIAW